MKMRIEVSELEIREEIAKAIKKKTGFEIRVEDLQWEYVGDDDDLSISGLSVLVDAEKNGD